MVKSGKIYGYIYMNTRVTYCQIDFEWHYASEVWEINSLFIKNQAKSSSENL